MDTLRKIEEKCIKKQGRDLILYFMELNLLRNELTCHYCYYNMSLVPYKRSVDKFSWRCMNMKCLKHKLYTSIRKNSFLKDLILNWI